MKVTEINKPIKEYRDVATPRDEAHYREMMKTLHDLELKSARDPETMAEIKRRRMELRNWAEQNIKREDMIPNNMPGNIGDYAHEKSTGKLVRIVDYTDDDEGIYTISYGEGKGETDVRAGDLEFVDPTVHQDLDDKILDKEVDEGFIGKKMEYNDFLQNKLDTAIQEYDTPEKQQARAELMKKYLAKGGKVEKVPAGKTAYKGKELKPAYKKDNGTPITSPGSDESAVKEEAPFDGQGILQRAVFNKWISAEEWFHLKDEWKQATQELEQRYDDWPEGEGFGSSDHNFAIRDLMSIVGYEFDDQDTSGKFVVTKMPEKLEKQGITNVRMRGEPIKAEAGAYQGDHAKIMMAIQNLKEMIVNAKMGDDEKTSALTSLDQVQQDIGTLYDSVKEGDGLQPVDLKRLGQSVPKIYVHKDGKTIMIPKSKHNEYLAKGWKQSALRAETSYESKLTDMLNQRLK